MAPEEDEGTGCWPTARVTPEAREKESTILRFFGDCAHAPALARACRTLALARSLAHKSSLVRARTIGPRACALPHCRTPHTVTRARARKLHPYATCTRVRLDHLEARHF